MKPLLALTALFVASLSMASPAQAHPGHDEGVDLHCTMANSDFDEAAGTFSSVNCRWAGAFVPAAETVSAARIHLGAVTVHCAEAVWVKNSDNDFGSVEGVGCKTND